MGFRRQYTSAAISPYLIYGAAYIIQPLKYADHAIHPVSPPIVLRMYASAATLWERGWYFLRAR